MIENVLEERGISVGWVAKGGGGGGGIDMPLQQNKNKKITVSF